MAYLSEFRFSAKSASHGLRHVIMTVRASPLLSAPPTGSYLPTPSPKGLLAVSLPLWRTWASLGFPRSPPRTDSDTWSWRCARCRRASPSAGASPCCPCTARAAPARHASSTSRTLDQTYYNPLTIDPLTTRPILVIKIHFILWECSWTGGQNNGVAFSMRTDFIAAWRFLFSCPLVHRLDGTSERGL